MTHLDKRKKEYVKIQKHTELYGQKLVYLPQTLLSFLREHKEINFSQYVTKMVYQLREQVEKQEFLDKNKDLIQYARRKVKEGKKKDKNWDKSIKRVNDMIKAYFDAKLKGNTELMTQSKQILERISPEVFDHFDALEQYCKDNPDYMDKDIPWEKIISRKKYDV